MIQLLLSIALLSSTAPAQAQRSKPALQVTVKDVTSEYQRNGTFEHSIISVFPTPAPTQRGGHVQPGIVSTLPPGSDPTPTPSPDLPPAPIPDTGIGTIGGVNIDNLITLGGKIWDFVLSSRPTADYKVFKSSIVPSGVTSWTQLRGWSRPIAKIYRVQFKDVFGGLAGGFDYRITYIPGGSFNGKGKFLGQISFVPLNIQLHTDRSLTVRAELSDPVNFGTETDPVAGGQLIVTWSSPTTIRYQMNSAEYFIYGTGEIDDLTNGN